MAYVITKMEDQLLDAISDPALWISKNPAYRGMFERIADTRQGHVERSAYSGGPTPELRKIASMPSTLYDVLKLTMSTDGYHLDKKRFRAWLERNPQYKSRDVDMGVLAGNT